MSHHIGPIDSASVGWIRIPIPIRMERWLAKVSRERGAREPAGNSAQLCNFLVRILLLFGFSHFASVC